MIAVVDYHMGNLKSVERGLIAVGADARITDEPFRINDADAIVLPGVGAFSDAVTSLHNLGQFDCISQRILSGVPFLGICLGLHLLYEQGQEGGLSQGFGFIDGTIAALPATDEAENRYKIPHVGWNTIDVVPEAGSAHLAQSFDGAYFYFTHSFAAPETNCTLATTTHSKRFTSIAKLLDLPAYGVQFHPEKSSVAGARFLKEFVDLTHKV